MKYLLVFALSVFFFGAAVAQKPADSTAAGTVTVIKDPRVDLLGKKMADFNDDISMRPHSGKGYRLMVISTQDRDLAMKIRSALYQNFPDQKQYMSYQLPNIKIKFGNFVDRDDAENARKQLMAMKLVTNNIYIVPETIEIKPEKKDKTKTPADN